MNVQKHDRPITPGLLAGEFSILAMAAKVPVVTEQDVARELNCHRKTAWGWIARLLAKGLIRVSRPGRHRDRQLTITPLGDAARKKFQGDVARLRYRQERDQRT